MRKKELLVGMLVVALAFGMLVVGCEGDSTDEPVEVNTTPPPPTGFTGTADGNSVVLTWQPVANASGYLLEFSKGYSDYQAVNDIITSTSYTVTGLDSNKKYTFRVYAQNAKGEKSFYSSVDVTTSNPKTGTVSIKALNTTHNATTMTGAGGVQVTTHSYTIEVQLELSNGAFWQWASADNSIVRPKAQSWVTSTGISGEFGYDGSDVSGYGETKIIYLRWSRSGISSPLTAALNVTAAIDQNKLPEMKGYTNITNTLTIGTPSTASSTAWVDRQ